MIDPLPEQEKEPAVIISRSFRVENGNYGPATFVVRVLFRRNSTWQGTVGWKEGKTLPGKLQKLYGTAPFNA